MAYKVCLFYNRDKIVEQDKTFAHHEEALEWLVWKRTKMSTLFGAVVYRHKRYLDYFLEHESWKVFKFVEDLDRWVIIIQGRPPLISYIENFKKNDMSLVFEDSLGFQISELKLVLVYTGGLPRRTAIAYILHEIGHAVFELRTRLTYDSFTLRHELEGWEFAVRNAEAAGLDPVYVRRIAKECLDTYLEDGCKGTGMPKRNWWCRYKKLTKQSHKLGIE
jgi:hypothetical protein